MPNAKAGNAFRSRYQ